MILLSTKQYYTEPFCVRATKGPYSDSERILVMCQSALLHSISARPRDRGALAGDREWTNLFLVMKVEVAIQPAGRVGGNGALLRSCQPCLHWEHVPSGCPEGAPLVVRLQRAQHAADGGEHAALTPVISATGVVMLWESEYTNFGRSRVEN